MNKFNQPDNKNKPATTGKPESTNQQQGNNKPKGEGKVEVGVPDAQDEQTKAQGNRKAS